MGQEGNGTEMMEVSLSACSHQLFKSHALYSSSAASIHSTNICWVSTMRLELGIQWNKTDKASVHTEAESLVGETSAK